MDFKNHKEVAIAFKLRMFALNVCRNREHYDMMLDWMDKPVSALKRNSKIYGPMVEVYRKLLFKYGKNVDQFTLRSKKFKNNWKSSDTFDNVMKDCLTHLEEKAEEYYTNIRNNRERKMQNKQKRNKNKEESDEEELEYIGSDFMVCVCVIQFLFFL